MNETSPSQAPTFDEWIEQASVSTLERELSEKERELTEMVEAIQELDTRAQGLHEEVTRRKRVLDVLLELHPKPSPAVITNLSKREIAERILMESRKPLFPREVRDIAVERGWLVDEPNAANQLSVAMNKAAKARKFDRDEEGRYSLRSENGAHSGNSDDLLFPDDPDRGDGP